LVEKLVTTAALILRAIHCGIRISKDLSGFVGRSLVEGDSNAGGNKNLVPAQIERRSEMFANPVSRMNCIIHMPDLIEDNRKLITSQSGYQVSRPQTRLDSARGSNQ